MHKTVSPAISGIIAGGSSSGSARRFLLLSRVRDRENLAPMAAPGRDSSLDRNAAAPRLSRQGPGSLPHRHALNPVGHPLRSGHHCNRGFPHTWSIWKAAGAMAHRTPIAIPEILSRSRILYRDPGVTQTIEIAHLAGLRSRVRDTAAAPLSRPGGGRQGSARQTGGKRPEGAALAILLDEHAPDAIAMRLEDAGAPEGRHCQGPTGRPLQKSCAHRSPEVWGDRAT